MDVELKTPLIANKDLYPAVSFVLAMVLATYLTACSTVTMNQAEEIRAAEARAAAELAIKEWAAAEQAMAARAEAERQAAAERAMAARAEAERQVAAEQAMAARAEAERRAAAEQAMAARAEAERQAAADERAMAARAEAERQTAEEQKRAKDKPPRPPTQPTLPTEPISSLESYSVTVSANEQLFIPGPPGELRVWIGISSKAPRNQPRMSTETIELGTIGETAKVKPFALGIDVDPKESICGKIDPTGSEVRFKLTPIKTGVFTVGADVELYNSNDCTGTAVPKSAKSVTVNVTVDKERVASDSIGELIKRAWKAFLDFWDKLLLAVFGLLIFLLRKKLYKLFGFESKE